MSAKVWNNNNGCPSVRHFSFFAGICIGFKRIYFYLNILQRFLCFRTSVTSIKTNKQTQKLIKIIYLIKIISWYCQTVVAKNCQFQDRLQYQAVHLDKDAFLSFLWLKKEIKSFWLNAVCSVPDNFLILSPPHPVQSPHLLLISKGMQPVILYMFSAQLLVILNRSEVSSASQLLLFLEMSFIIFTEHWKSEFLYVMSYLDKLRQTDELWRCIVVYLSVRYSEILPLQLCCASRGNICAGNTVNQFAEVCPVSPKFLVLRWGQGFLNHDSLGRFIIICQHLSFLPTCPVWPFSPANRWLRCFYFLEFCHLGASSEGSAELR